MIWLQRLSLAGIGTFFILSGLFKVVDPGAFAEAIGRYRLIGDPLTIGIALWLPWIECLAGVALWHPRWRFASGLLLFGLLLVFQLVLASAWFRGLDISCGCLGSGTDTSVPFAIFRNFILMGLLVPASMLKTPSR